MLGVLVDDRCNRIVANDIHTATHQHEALRRKIRHLRRFRQPRCEPRLDRMTVGRRNVERLSGQLTPDMTCYDESGVRPGPDVPPPADVPRPMQNLCGPEDPAASQIAEANEPRGAMTASGHIGPSTIHR